MKPLTVVIPARNNAGTLEACLKALKASVFTNYELIVVDAASTDDTGSIAKKYADQVITLMNPAERSRVRSHGAQAAQGKVIVNIDSDVIVQPETIGLIHSFFEAHPEIDAVTGILSKNIPFNDFFSQYKNLYMHFIFKNLPDKVTFLYGSVYAIRREARDFYISRAKIADDTALGQELTASGKKVAFLKDLEVVHLKKHTFLSWVKNDFQIPFDWSKIFLQYRGWKQFGRNKTGFAHASKKQLLSVVTAPVILLLLAAGKLQAAAGLLFLWAALNSSFLSFLAREKGSLFGLAAIFATLFDHFIMAAGIGCGLMSAWFEKKND